LPVSTHNLHSAAMGVFLNTLSVAAEAPLDATADSMSTTGFTQTAIKLSPVFSPAVRVALNCVGVATTRSYRSNLTTHYPTCTEGASGAPG
jgi:hypothetical protein